MLIKQNQQTLDKTLNRPLKRLTLMVERLAR